MSRRTSLLPPQSHSHAFSLIELLVAIGVASVVIVAVTSIYHSVAVGARAASSSQACTAEATRALDGLARDAACTVGRDSDNRSPFILDSGSMIGKAAWPTLMLRCTMEASADQTNEQWQAVSVRYFMDAEGEAQTESSVLMRERRITNPLTGKTEVTSDVVLENVRSLTIEVYDGLEWTSSWPREDGAAVPKAARISLSCTKGSVSAAVSTIAVIPSGA